MQRRALLSTLAAGVTVGCVGAPLSSIINVDAYRVTEYDVSSRTTSPHSSPAIASSIRVLDDRVTAESPGILEISVINESETPQRITAGHNGSFGLLSGDGPSPLSDVLQKSD
jgi:hypothetical protein